MTTSASAREKGKEFERIVARGLSKWWGVPFVRIPNSGWGHGGQRGDIMIKQGHTPKYPFPWTVECKSVKGWDLFQLMLEKSLISKMWLQAYEEGIFMSNNPMLVIRLFGREVYAFIESDNEVLRAFKKAKLPFFRFNQFNSERTGFKKTLVIVRFDELIQSVSSEAVSKILTI